MCFYWIAAIGGLQAAAVIAAGLNKSCNIMIIQADAHSDYDDLHWTIEADRGGEGDIINPELVDEEAVSNSLKLVTHFRAFHSLA